MSKKENKHDIGKSALQNIKEESLRKQQALEQEWVATLRERYPVKIYDDVLKTVNQH